MKKKPNPAQAKWTFASVTPSGSTNSAINSGAGSSSYQSAPLRSGRPSPIHGTSSSVVAFDAHAVASATRRITPTIILHFMSANPFAIAYIVAKRSMLGNE